LVRPIVSMKGERVWWMRRKPNIWNQKIKREESN
jgi:hypothetical protein